MAAGEPQLFYMSIPSPPWAHLSLPPSVPLLQEQPHSQPAGQDWRALNSTATVQHTAHVPTSLQPSPTQLPSRLDSCMQEPPLV